MMSQPNDFNQTLIAEFRANGGQILTGPFAGRSLLLLTTRGARSGQPRTSPLAYLADGERLVVIASKAGAPTNPDWYHNLVANPEVTVELGSERYQARAVVAEGAERERLFAQVAAQMPGFAAYQEKTTRQLPVVVLERLA
jgi:deazaflavin-dependent oxidoreductase (nitroreductase family)